jgi:hypothetical protein
MPVRRYDGPSRLAAASRAGSRRRPGHTGRGGGADAQHRVRALHPRQRPRGDLAPRPVGAAGGDERLVSRRQRRRDAGQERLRPPLRAHDVPGGQAHRQGRALQHPAGHRRDVGERHDEQRPHQLLRGGAVASDRDGAVARERPHGLSARPAGRREPEEPAGGGAQRATAALRQRAVRARALRGGGDAVPGGAPVSLLDDRPPRGPRGGVDRRRQGVLPRVVCAEQRDADAGR